MQRGYKVNDRSSEMYSKFDFNFKFLIFIGFRRLRDFVVTQHPLVSTIKDFWQMVWDHSVQTIVLLSTLDDMVSFVCWPAMDSIVENLLIFIFSFLLCSYLSVISTILARRFIVN